MPNSEYFPVDERVWPKLQGVPGWTRHKSQLYAHRTHKPLLEGPEEPFRITPEKLKELNSQLNGFALRKYQWEGVRFLQSRPGAILGDQPRLGKTVQALMAVKNSIGPVLIVYPLPARDVWVEWVRKIDPEANLVVLEGTKYKPEKLLGADYVMVHYNILWSWQPLANIQFFAVIYDEAHLLSNSRSKRTRASAVLTTRAYKVIALTGTPLWNKPSQLFNLLQLVCKGGWGTYKEYTERYCHGRSSDYGWVTGDPDPRHARELSQRLSSILLARTWDDVMTHVPEVIRSTTTIELTADERINLSIDLKELKNTEGATVIGEMSRLRKLTAERKVKPAAELAEEVLGSGEPIVLWVWHRNVAQRLSEVLAEYDPVVIIGNTPKRDALIEEWRQQTSPRPLIISILIGQVGIDLSTAKHAVFVEIDYTPAVLSQAEMRTFSPRRPMAVTYFMTDHWIERRIVMALMEKFESAKAIGVACADMKVDYEELFNELEQEDYLPDLWEE